MYLLFRPTHRISAHIPYKRVIRLLYIYFQIHFRAIPGQRSEGQRSDLADTRRRVCQGAVRAGKRYRTNGHLRQFRLVTAELKVGLECPHRRLGNKHDPMGGSKGRFACYRRSPSSFALQRGPIKNFPFQRG